MKKLLLITIALFSITQQASALLSPLNQSIREIMTILADPKIKELGQNNAILDLQRTEEGYLIVTKDSQMSVDILYKERRGAAPLKFDLVFHDPISILPATK